MGWNVKMECRNMQRFQGGLAFKASRLFYHSTLGLRVIKRKESWGVGHHRSYA
jgi:hypothetical protein